MISCLRRSHDMEHVASFAKRTIDALMLLLASNLHRLKTTEGVQQDLEGQHSQYI